MIDLLDLQSQINGKTTTDLRFVEIVLGPSSAILEFKMVDNHDFVELLNLRRNLGAWKTIRGKPRQGESRARVP